MLFILGGIPGLLHADDKGWLSESEINSLIVDIANALKGLKSIKAPFKQVRELWIFNDKLVSSGICYFQQPDKLRWEIKEPFSSLLIYNQEQVAKFNYKNGQWEKLKLGTEDVMKLVMKEIIYWMKGNFQRGKEFYDVKIQQKENYTFLLTPKFEEMKQTIRKIELTLDKKTKHVLDVKIFEPSQDSITITFYNEENDLTFPEKIFSTSDPLIQKGTN
jgi:outer membrane lipoprotein-sorting protein